MSQNSAGPATAPPSNATNAVLLPSDPMPDGAQKVQGIDFNAYHDANMTAAELVDGMANMGFQASAVADAVQIINQMVRPLWNPSVQCSSDCSPAVLDRSRHGRKDNHFSRLHL